MHFPFLYGALESVTVLRHLRNRYIIIIIINTEMPVICENERFVMIN